MTGAGVTDAAANVHAHPWMGISAPPGVAEMLHEVGLDGFAELFEQIPAAHLMQRPLDLPEPLTAEASLHRHLAGLLAKNQTCADHLNFLGAGCWQHYVPAVCDEIVSRSEFLTPVWGTSASDFGRNQAWFEYASGIGELVGLDFVGLPVYSWGCAAGHAIRMAARLTGRAEVLIPRSIDPERLKVIRTYCAPSGLHGHVEIVLVDIDPGTGRISIDDLRAKLSETTAAVYLETPGFLGVIEADAPEVARLARAAGAETIAGVDPISLGVLAPPGEWGADIAVGSTQPLGVHMNCGGGAGGFIATRDEPAYAHQYPTLQVSIAGTTHPGERSFGVILFEQTSYGSRELGNDWTGNSVYLWAVANAVFIALLGPQGFREIGEAIVARSHYAAKRLAELPGVTVRYGGFFKELVADFTGTGRTVADINEALLAHGIFGGKDLSGDFPELGQSALLCVTEIHTQADIDLLAATLGEILPVTALRRYHAAVWDEPLVQELSRPGARGLAVPPVEQGIRDAVGDIASLLPASMRRGWTLDLPELSEPDVLRHYLHLSQETLGMMGISLFGTCTMKYNPRVSEQLTRTPAIAELHPYQDDATLQGVLEIVAGLERLLCELSGMSSFVFQAGGGADAAYLHACMTRAYHAARGELAQRDEIITSIQAHPCNPATAAAAGFKVITLPLEEDGYPSLDALKAAVSERTASLMINNPDDMGIYNPNIDRWVEVVHDAGGLCFYDHANFNGVMGKIRASELGFDACMFMLHKTFGAPKAGGGPAVGAYGCSAELARFLPGPRVVADGDGYRLEEGTDDGVGRVREFIGNVPQVVKAYAWVRGMGGEAIREAAELSVLANNYMEKKLLAIPGITKSQPHLTQRRMEMTRYSLEELTKETGITVLDVQNRMVDYGVDAFWLSHEPWVVPEPFTPEAGEMWSKDDIDYWIAVLAKVCEEARTDPQLVKTAPHNQVVHQLDPAGLDDPERWATTYRAYVRKSRR